MGSCRRCCPPSPGSRSSAGTSTFANPRFWGLVGAGGIGLQLSASLNVLAWPQVALILLVILLAVVVSEWVSAKVRGAII